MGGMIYPPSERPSQARLSPPKNLSTMIALDAVEQKTDESIEQFSGNVSCEPTRFQNGSWKKVAIRSFAMLSALSEARIRQKRKGFTRDSMERAAILVGEYHGYRHTPRIDRSGDWPKDKTAFCAEKGITVSMLDHALFLVRYHRWEKRYLDYTAPEVRVAMVKDVLLAASVRQLEADPGKENANLLRTALQGEGELKGTQKITQVNVGSNVINMPENLTEEDLRARLDRVNRLAELIKPKEVPHEEVPNEP